jgi:hypothetical protein
MYASEEFQLQSAHLDDFHQRLPDGENEFAIWDRYDKTLLDCFSLYVQALAQRCKAAKDQSKVL